LKQEIFFKDPGLPFAECRYSMSNRHYKPHIHKAFSIGGIKKGKVVYEIEGKRLELKGQHLALINPEVLHTCNPDTASERSYYILHLGLDWCLKLQQSLWQVKTFCPVNTIILSDPLLFKKYIAAVTLLMGKGERLEKEGLLADLVEQIFLKTCDPGPEQHPPSPKIKELKGQLSRNLDVDLSMGELASELNANPYTLLRQFKAETGITPHAFRINCRIEKARKLLQKGLDLPQVALECGFFDQSHFHHQFKAVTTVTPRAYQINFLQ